MMRPSSVVLVSLLALSLLLSEAQGIRFNVGLLSVGHDQPAEIHESKKMSNMILETSHEDGSVGESIAGMNRKLITTTTTTTSASSTTTSKINEKNDENKANPSSSSSKSKSSDREESTIGTNNSPPPSTSENSEDDHDEISHNHYHVDITDITEMDYSSARRKPPIHN